MVEVLVFEYQNPTSRCAGCGLDQGCCDEFANTTCLGDERCDNIFSFCIRPFESGPTVVETDCLQGLLTTTDEFIFNNNHLIFSIGETALNGLPNPLPFAIDGNWTVSV